MAQKNTSKGDAARQRGKGAAMSKSSQRSGKERAAGRAIEVRPGDDDAPPFGLWILGIGFLLVSVGASAVLAYAHFADAQLPGCGPQSGCAAATNSEWGKLPVLGYPVSLLGLAFFVAMLIGWAMCRGGVSAGIKWLARVGAAASLFFIVVMFATGLTCTYCITAHVGNLLFWLVVEVAGAAAFTAGRPFVATQAAFAVLTLLLAGAEWQKRADVLVREEGDLGTSTTKIIAGTDNERFADYPPIIQDAWAENDGFRGRYLHGPEVAPIRVVIFSDYQCPDCLIIHSQLKSILESRDDVSVTAKHFPMCWDCNPHLTTNPHPDACYAARVAEAAGMTWGAEAFWQFNNWLFEVRRGAVSDQVLFEFCQSLGHEPTSIVQFISLAKNDSTSLWPVTQDIEEGVALGLRFTPMIFINGVELKGWKAPNALRRAIEAVAASNPAPARMGSDRPVTAQQKIIADWMEEDVQVILPDSYPRTRGEAGAPVSMIVFGDYEDDNTADLDAAIRQRIASGAKIEYHFRHFPGNQACNPDIDLSPHANACFAAQAAEAAGRIGGEDGYWRMHDWLLEHRSGLSEEVILSGAAELGFDRDEFIVAMQAIEVELAIRQDAQAGRVLVQRATLPIVVINGKRAPQWKHQDQLMLDELIAAAQAGGGSE